jgi:hypothetical protein
MGYQIREITSFRSASGYIITSRLLYGNIFPCAQVSTVRLISTNAIRRHANTMAPAWMTSTRSSARALKGFVEAFASKKSTNAWSISHAWITPGVSTSLKTTCVIALLPRHFTVAVTAALLSTAVRTIRVQTGQLVGQFWSTNIATYMATLVVVRRVTMVRCVT